MAKAKLGIRPIIDGRWGGVRESLEEKTMNMALAAKKLIEENVFYSDGTPFECIISPCTIGGAAEAAKCADFRTSARPSPSPPAGATAARRWISIP